MSTLRRKKRSRNEMEEDELQALQEAVQAHLPQMDKNDELDREKDMQWYNKLKDRRWENTNILRRVLVGTFQPSDGSEKQQVWAWRDKNDSAMLQRTNVKMWKIVPWDQVKFSVSRAEWEVQITQKKKIADVLEMMERSNTADKKITKIEADLLFKHERCRKVSKDVATMAGHIIEEGYEVPESLTEKVQRGRDLLQKLRDARGKFGIAFPSPEAVAMAARYLGSHMDLLPDWFKAGRAKYTDEFIQRFHDYVTEPEVDAPCFRLLNEEKIGRFISTTPFENVTQEDFDMRDKALGNYDKVIRTKQEVDLISHCNYIGQQALMDILEDACKQAKKPRPPFE